jgi:hypothetical protein
MSDKEAKSKGREEQHQKHKDKDLEKWAELEKPYQHPGNFQGPLEEVDIAAGAEAAERRKQAYAEHRAAEKKDAED